MAKKDQEAFGIIVDLINNGKVVQFKKWHENHYMITVWHEYDKNIDHNHYDGKSLIDALSKIKK